MGKAIRKEVLKVAEKSINRNGAWWMVDTKTLKREMGANAKTRLERTPFR